MFLCLGINHRTTTVELRERLAFAETKRPEAALEIKALPDFKECVVLSTCNRVELYCVTEEADATEKVNHLLDYLSSHFQLEPSQREALAYYGLSQTDAARHLFRVVSGLDSMVLGETEIFGQVKAAYEAAHRAGATGGGLNKLFQRANTVGKLVRNQTTIQRGSTSVGSVAVELAEKVFGSPKHCNVLLIGAGEMSRICAQSLMSRGAKSIFISNRHYERAVELATEMKGTALRFDEWEKAIHQVDIVISSTSAPHFVVTPELIAPLMRKRHGRPLFIFDIAVPRDVDPRVTEIDEVYLYDIDSLQKIAEEGRCERQRALTRCEEIIEEQLRKFGYAEEEPIHAPITVSTLPAPPINAEV